MVVVLRTVKSCFDSLGNVSLRLKTVEKVDLNNDVCILAFGTERVGEK